MTEEESLARHSAQAVRTAAEVLGVKPLVLAKLLQDGEIARLMQLLNAALPHVPRAGLRHRIEDLLSAVTEGRMPMFKRPESELDWAMETLRKRRRNAQPDDDATPDDDGTPDDGTTLDDDDARPE